MPTSLSSQTADLRTVVTAAQQYEIEKYIRTASSDYSLAGLVLAVAYKGIVVYEHAIGSATKEDLSSDIAARRMSNHSLLRIASLSKPITATMVMMLVEAGRMALGDRPLSATGLLKALIPTSGIKDTRYADITVDQLLMHTSGCPSNNASDPMSAAQAIAYDDEALLRWTVQNMSLEFQPGTSYAYSNFGYFVLGRCIEAALANSQTVGSWSYAEAVKFFFLDAITRGRMAISSNRFVRTSDVDHAEADYYSNTGSNPYADNVARMDSHGGWIATASDMAGFAWRGFALLSSGSVGAMKTVSPASTFTYPNGSTGGYGKGWEVSSAGIWWHSGRLDGTRSFMMGWPEGMTAAVITNTSAADATRVQTNQTVATQTSLDFALQDIAWYALRAKPAWKALEPV